jgi:hypothetical protein
MVIMVNCWGSALAIESDDILLGCRSHGGGPENKNESEDVALGCRSNGCEPDNGKESGIGDCCICGGGRTILVSGNKIDGPGLSSHGIGESNQQQQGMHVWLLTFGLKPCYISLFRWEEKLSSGKVVIYDAVVPGLGQDSGFG